MLPLIPIRPFQAVNARGRERWNTAVPLIPLRAAAGSWSDEQVLAEQLVEHAEEWVEFKRKKGRFEKGMFVAQVAGRSMEPEIPDGSYCLFRPAGMGSTENRRVLVWHEGVTDAETGGMYTVKVFSQVRRLEGGRERIVTELRPLNPDFDPIVVDDDRLRVLAEVVEVLAPIGDA